MDLIAYRVGSDKPWSVRPAGLRRQWMNAFTDQWPYRCLPLNIANQAGWELLCPVSVEAKWDGGDSPDSLHVEFDEHTDEYAHLIKSHFGGGILTFAPPLLFRTQAPVGLFVRGPCNFWIDGAAALDGWVESWGLEATFTMNWKLTRPGVSVRFDKGQPICLLQPFEIDLLERTRPVVKDLEEEPELAARHERWMKRRFLFGAVRTGNQSQSTYVQGRDEEGNQVAGHRTDVELREFSSVEPDRVAE